MIKQLKTKNFRKLVDTVIDFGPGLQTVRGANEAGKSTTVEAIAYALSGIKACRDVLGGVVTWGQPEKSLSVQLVLECDSVDYVFKRSKAGAEVVWCDGRVTGQTEVSAFAEQLLGAGNGSSTKLMFAPQGAIRGALSEGPRATMDLIEKLADFTVIDEVVDLIQSKLITGPAATAEDRVARAGLAVENLKSQIVRPNTDEATLRLAECDRQIILANREITDTWEKRHADSKAAWEEAQRQKAKKDMLAKMLATAEMTQANHSQQRDAATAAALLSPHPKIAADLAVKLHKAEQHAELSAAWKQLQALQASYPEAFWDEPRSSFDTALQGMAAGLAAAQATLATLQASGKGLKIPTATDKCPTCGQTLPNAEAIAQHKADVIQQIAENAAAVAVAKTTIAVLTENWQKLQVVSRASAAYDNFALAHRTLVRCEDTAVPPRLFWIGLPIPEAPNLPAILAEIADVRAKTAAADRAAALAEVLKTTLGDDGRVIAGLNEQLAGLGEADKVDELGSAYEKVASQYNYWINLRVENTYARQKLQADIAQALAAYEQSLAAVKAAEALVREAETDLKVLEFNNALLKRVRAARPIIADRLWNTVLAAVSGYFSQMRGQKSVVLREANDFTVDGHSIAGLSGSTLDVLGLAIRLALTRTFLPTTPFLILDEPCAAMDLERETATLGFLAAAGFKQTLLITHSDLAETVASGLITL